MTDQGGIERRLTAIEQAIESSNRTLAESNRTLARLVGVIEQAIGVKGPRCLECDGTGGDRSAGEAVTCSACRGTGRAR